VLVPRRGSPQPLTTCRFSAPTRASVCARPTTWLASAADDLQVFGADEGVRLCSSRDVARLSR